MKRTNTRCQKTNQKSQGTRWLFKNTILLKHTLDLQLNFESFFCYEAFLLSVSKKSTMLRVVTWTLNWLSWSWTWGDCWSSPGPVKRCFLAELRWQLAMKFTASSSSKSKENITDKHRLQNTVCQGFINHNQLVIANCQMTSPGNYLNVLMARTFCVAVSKMKEVHWHVFKYFIKPELQTGSAKCSVEKA